MTTTRPADELHVLIGGSLDEIYSQLMAEVDRKEFGYAPVKVVIIETSAEFLQTDSQSRPELFMVHLYFGNPDLETITDPINARIADATGIKPAWIAVGGRGIVIYICAPKPASR